MALKMHHTHATFLRLRNITIVPDEQGFATTNLPSVLRGTGKQIIDAIKIIETDTGKKLRGTGSADKSGVMVKTYHELYTANGGGNADLLDTTMRDELMVEKDGELSLDRAKLKRLAKDHDVWNDRYEQLNPGMARMNVANRLRALIRKDGEISVFGTVISEADLKPRPAAKPKAVKPAKAKKAKAQPEQVAV